MKLSYGPDPMTLPLALTIPAVTVCSSPKGLPTATTQAPTFRSSELPKVRGCRSVAPVNFYDRQIGLGVPAYDFAFILFPIGKFHLDLVRILDHVIIGEDIPVLAHDKPGANSLLFVSPGRFVLGERPEKVPEGIPPQRDYRGNGVFPYRHF